MNYEIKTARTLWTIKKLGTGTYLPVYYTCSCCQWESERRFCGRMALMTHCPSPVRQQENENTPVLKSLHWLPICRRIDYKILSLTYPVLAWYCTIISARVDHSISACTFFAVFFTVKTLALHLWLWGQQPKKKKKESLEPDPLNSLPQNSGIIFQIASGK